jgi:glycosyltransferase involved in cell wall biosynthesis
LKILQIVPSISLVYGGPSQMVLGLSAALAAQGVDVTILTTNANGDAGQPPLEVPLGQPLAQAGCQILYFPCSPFRRYKFSLGLLRWLATHAGDYDLAHIHALFSPISTAAATVARYCGLPYILRPLGTLDPADLQKKRRLKQVYGWLWERPNLAGAAAVHFTSEQECQVSYRYGAATRDLVLPLGVELPEALPAPGQARQRLNIAPERPLILFLSRIEPKKGLALLLPALEKLQAKGLAFTFALAGSNPQDPNYEAQIQQQLAASPLAADTHILGFVRGAEKFSLLQDADLFVLPSYYENFGIAVAEAMAVGTPVVISNCVYIWQVVAAAAAGWVSACEVNDLADQLQEALLSPLERQRRGENARSLALEKYSWQVIARQMLQHYQSLT